MTDQPRASKPVIGGKQPITLELQPGRYSWCTCGFSESQPFCDTAHREKSELKSLKFEVTEPTVVMLCTCKQTRTPPFCDDTHLELDD